MRLKLSLDVKIEKTLTAADVFARGILCSVTSPHGNVGLGFVLPDGSVYRVRGAHGTVYDVVPGETIESITEDGGEAYWKSLGRAG